MASVLTTVRSALRWRNLLRLLLLVLSGLLVWSTLTTQGRVFAKSALFIPSLVPGSPIRPVALVSPRPRKIEVTFSDSSETWTGDLYLPDDRGSHPGMVVALGVNPAGPDDPRVRSLGDGLARMGVVALIPQSPNLIARTVTTREIDFMVAAFQYLRGRPEVNPARVGFMGICVGSSLSALAAEDPRIGEQVDFVSWFGGYYRLEDLVVSTATHSFEVAGRVSAWTPDPLTEEVMKRAVIGFVDREDERQVLEKAILGGEPLTPEQEAGLSSTGTLVYRLFSTSDPAEAREILARMPASSHEFMRALSPATHIANLKARVWIMDDVDDPLIPYVHSRDFASNLDGRVAHRSEFSVFSHVDLDRLANPIRTVPQMWSLFLHVHGIFQAIL